MHVGELVRLIRTNRKMTLGELAAAARVSPTTLGKMERTGVGFTRTSLVSIASALGTTEGELYALVREQNRNVRAALIAQMADEPRLKPDREHADDQIATAPESLDEQVPRVMAQDLQDPVLLEAFAILKQLDGAQRRLAVRRLGEIRDGLEHPEHRSRAKNR